MRQHFIVFVVYLVQMMTLLLGPTVCKYCIKEIIVCLMKILRKVDLSFYGEKAENFKVSQDHRITNKLNSRHMMKGNDSDLVISSELEVKQILSGLKQIMYHCLDLKAEGMLTVKEEFNYSIEVEDTSTFADKFKKLFSANEFNSSKSVGNSEPEGLK